MKVIDFQRNVVIEVVPADNEKMGSRWDVKHTTKIEDMIRRLPPELQSEVEDFVQFLIERRMREPVGQLTLDWRGALRDLRGQYTSVELQHKVLQWWGD